MIFLLLLYSPISSSFLAPIFSFNVIFIQTNSLIIDTIPTHSCPCIRNPNDLIPKRVRRNHH
ncbi:hypothetical protein AtNW77_Chr5g0124251 [Arabidopsis thaliana]